MRPDDGAGGSETCGSRNCAISCAFDHCTKQICGVAVKTLNDFEKTKTFSMTADGLVENGPLTFPKSDVLQFLLEDGTKVSVRPSGTEPKIKFYVSVKESLTSSSPDELVARKKRCQERLGEIERAFVILARS